MKHAAWVLNHFLVHDDGCSSFHTRYGKGPLPRLAEFGEISFKAHCRQFAAKPDASFSPGLWVGRDPDSGEHLAMSSAGVCEARAIKRMQPFGRLSPDFLETPTAVPWNLRDDGSFGPSFLFIE